MTYEVVEDRTQPGVWRVEGIDEDGEGACQVAVFSGSMAEEHARQWRAVVMGAVEA